MLKGVFRMVAANRECYRISSNASLSDSRNTWPIMLYTILSYHYWNPSQKFRNVVSIPYWFTLLISAIIIKKKLVQSLLYCIYLQFHCLDIVHNFLNVLQFREEEAEK